MQTRRPSIRRATVIVALLIGSGATAFAQVDPMLDGRRRGIPNPEQTATVFASGTGVPEPFVEPVVVHAAPLRAALRSARQRRIDLVGSGDSNQNYQLHGWTTGFTKALLERGFEMYATGLMCQSQNKNSGHGFGMPIAGIYANGERGSRVGAPAFFGVHGSPWDPIEGTAAFANHTYCFADADLAAPGTGRLGMNLDPGLDVLGMSHALRFHLMLGRFEGEGDGQLIMDWRDWTHNVGLASKVVTTEGAASDEIIIETLDLPAGPRDFELFARQMVWTTLPDWRGRIWTLYHRIENIGRFAGFAYHTWGDHGGKGLRHLVGMMMEASTPEYRQTYLGEVARLQAEDPIVIHVINHGFNDRSDTRLSLGPAGQAGMGYQSRTPEGFKDNMQGLIDLVTADHVETGIPAESVYFLLMPSHRLGDGDQANEVLESYRAVCAELARENPRTCFVNLAALISAEEMTVRDYYEGGGGPVHHLTPEGYEALSRMVFDAILDGTPCRPDLNADGFVSLVDLLSMLSAWGSCAANCPADVDDSGAVDFLDLITLLANWGPCGSPDS